MAENATISGGAATARTKESEESTVRDEARNAGEKAAAAVAESLAQLEPRPRKARATAVEDVAGTLDAIVEGVRPASAEGESATEPHRRTSKKASGAAKASESKKKAGEAKSGDAPEEGSGLRFSSAEEPPNAQIPAVNMTALLFQEPDTSRVRTRRRSRGEDASSSPSRRRKATGGETSEEPQEASSQPPAGSGESGQDAVGEREPRRRRRGSRGRRKGAETPETPSGGEESQSEAPREEAGGTRRRRRRARSAQAAGGDGVTTPKGSTRLEAKRQRRKEGREAGRRRHVITESEYLARRESVKREMLIREQDGLNQIAVLEDDVLVEHYVARHTQVSMVGNVYLGRVQNVLPSMEAAFVDIGKGRNAVLYAGEVNWEAAGLEGKPRRIEQALKSGDVIMVQVTKDPIGHKGARLTSQITLAGRYLVLVPGGSMTGISRKLPDTERSRLKKILKRIVPDSAGVIVRTAAEGATQEQLTADVERLVAQWETIEKKSSSVIKGSGKAPVLLKGEPELAVRVIRDVFNEDFRKLIVSGDKTWSTISQYIDEVSPDLAERLEHWTGPEDVFAAHRVDEQLAKGFDRKVWLPSGGTLVIDRTEAMTVIDVNTGRFTGAGGTLEETVTRNNLEAAEEIVRQLRLRDIGGMVVIDFVDMVLESNRDLVLRRLVECLGRDRTRHQVTEVTSLGLVQMTRKRVGQGLVEAFSTTCEHCKGRGFIVHDEPVENQRVDMSASASRGGRSRGRKNREEQAAAGGGKKDAQEARRAQSGKSDDKTKGSGGSDAVGSSDFGADDEARAVVRGALAQIAAAAEQAHKEAQETRDAVGLQGTGEERAGNESDIVEKTGGQDGRALVAEDKSAKTRGRKSAKKTEKKQSEKKSGKKSAKKSAKKTERAADKPNEKMAGEPAEKPSGSKPAGRTRRRATASGAAPSAQTAQVDSGGGVESEGTSGASGTPAVASPTPENSSDDPATSA